MSVASGVQRSTLVGRDLDLAAVRRSVTTSPVTTVTGPGGVGKTALALAVATGVRADFGDRVGVAMLGSLRRDSLVAGEVAACVGLPRSKGLPYAEALVSWLDRDDYLLVLDNCEHVVDKVAQLVDRLTGRLPGLRVLATSREPLAVPGEVEHRLSPLSLPPSGAPVEGVEGSDAVRLFVERARAHAPGLDVSGRDGELVAEICRRLDGLPLAIELAAARVAALDLEDMARHLDDLFRLLPRPARGSDARQRSLRSTVEWSVSLLDPDERVLLRRLSVFAGGFDLAAVEGVAALDGDTPGAVADRTARLVEKSLLVKNRPGAGYRMLETIRHLAAEQLSAAGETEAIRARHARWFQELGMAAGAGLMSGDERAWLEKLAHAEDNLRVALDRLISGLDPAGGLALATSLSMFWWTHGRHREGIRWLESAVAAAPDAPAELRAAGWFHLGFLVAHDTDDWAAAAELLDRGIRLASAGDGEPPVLGYLLCLRGECAVFTGDHRHGLELATRGLSVIRTYPDPWGAGFGLWNVGFAHLAAGDLDEAESCFEDMVDLQRRHGIGLVLMIGCRSLGEIAERRRDLPRARALYEEALRLRRELGAARLGYVHGSLPESLLAVARVAAEQGDATAALDHLDEALPLAEQLRDDVLGSQVRALLDVVRPSAGTATGVLEHQGGVWTIEFTGRRVHVADSKGLRHLRELLCRPHQPVPAVVLAAAVDDVAPTRGDAGPMLDRTALGAYRERLRDLDEELDEADRDLDGERSAKLHRERDALVSELARATGLGGRSRRAGSSVERARLNVTRTVRHAVREIAAVHPDLGAHLDRSVRTGTTCSYEPVEAVTWRV